MAITTHFYPSRVFHSRLEPKHHQFSYQTHYYLFDIDEIDRVHEQSSLFKHNRWGVFSIHDKDYLAWGEAPLKDKVLRILNERGLATPEKIFLLTCPRYFNYVFNPVSFFFCLDSKNQIQNVIVEINNTFKEKHVYVLHDLTPDGRGFWISRREKTFHVSPFYSKEMNYRFEFSDFITEKKDYEIRIILEKNDKTIFFSNLKGSRRDASSAQILYRVLREPWVPAVTMLRILWQAGILYYWKGLHVYKKPKPSSPDTLRSDPKSYRDRFALWMMKKFFGRLQTGHLEIILPDGRSLSFGNKNSRSKARIHVHQYAFFWKCLWSADVGFGESYVEGDWSCDNLTQVLCFFIDHHEELSDHRLHWPALGRLINQVRHRFRKNTRSGARRNIYEHYDLGNDFFQTFLDPKMQYSCALFKKVDDDLERAQIHKIHSLISKAEVKSTDHVLEIGCGWGGFAVELVKQTGCRYTGITISRSQWELAQARCEQEGLQDKMEFKILDYRDLTGQFDKIISCEMLEAVGHENLPHFFEACERVLNPNGLMVLQVISLPDQRYERARQKTDWIQRHIFPGSVCPSLQALISAMVQSSQLIVDHIENIGPHYAKTLSEWQRRLMQNQSFVSSRYPAKDFLPKWQYYFSYCEAGFLRGFTHNYQMILRRPGTRRLGALPA